MLETHLKNVLTRYVIVGNKRLCIDGCSYKMGQMELSPEQLKRDHLKIIVEANCYRGGTFQRKRIRCSCWVPYTPRKGRKKWNYVEYVINNKYIFPFHTIIYWENKGCIGKIKVWSNASILTEEHRQPRFCPSMWQITIEEPIQCHTYTLHTRIKTS